MTSSATRVWIKSHQTRNYRAFNYYFHFPTIRHVTHQWSAPSTGHKNSRPYHIYHLSYRGRGGIPFMMEGGEGGGGVWSSLTTPISPQLPWKRAHTPQPDKKHAKNTVTLQVCVGGQVTPTAIRIHIYSNKPSGAYRFSVILVQHLLEGSTYLKSNIIYHKQ